MPPRRGASVATRYGETLFRSRLEARWAAFFDLADIKWEYEPKASIKGWWPDFMVSGIDLDGKKYSVLTEVKPLVFSPISVDPAYAKALHPKWTLLLGLRPDGDYIGFLACQRNTLKTIAVRLAESGLEGAPLNLCEYGSRAARLWNIAAGQLPNVGISAAINGILERKMGKKLFNFGDEFLMLKKIPKAEP